MNMNVPKPLGAEFDFRPQIRSKLEHVSRKRSKLLSYAIWGLIAAGFGLIVASLSLKILLIIAAVCVALIASVTALLVYVQNNTPWC